jgi:ubiquinone/menaquinone biosynthesis C-methylase UbiE
MELLEDFYTNLPRQGPGSEQDTQRALLLTGLQPNPDLQIADIGCGTGAQTICLARATGAKVVAVDILEGFLERLRSLASAEGLSDRISTLRNSMDNLPFEEESLDLIWSEGAIYNMGFARGVRAWMRFLKPGAFLAVSEITWLSGQRPQEVELYWKEQYPEIDTASAKIRVLEDCGLMPIGYFPLRESSWTANYYRHVEANIAPFLARHPHSDTAQALAAENRLEMDLYARYKDYFSYGFYVARKC